MAPIARADLRARAVSADQHGGRKRAPVEVCTVPSASIGARSPHSGIRRRATPLWRQHPVEGGAIEHRDRESRR